MENSEVIDTNSILIKELESELEIIRNNMIDKNNKLEENEKEIKCLKEKIESNEKIVAELYKEKEDLQRKIESIECSRTYKAIRKIKRVLGGKK